ncbi:MAG: LysM peptidoglycan-binding domain-containing protein [Anaerolineales bacterium]|nr:LysM peptidoglycan-binding domain-containing protein [Anaerolineales bacterium]
MRNMHRQSWVLVLLAMTALIIAGCTRPASTAPSADQSGENGSAQATMDAMMADLLTQTAQPDSTPTPIVELPAATETEPGPTDTPVVVANTPTPYEYTGEYIEYTVQPGDWLYSIASEFNVDPEAIMAANNMSAPDDLEEGQTILIPIGEAPEDDVTPTAISGGRTHTVQPGEWVYSIARLYGVDPQTIIDANNLPWPFTLYPGDVLIIP